MGVDYTAHFGIGIQVYEPDDFDTNPKYKEYDGDFCMYLEEVLQNIGDLVYFKTGAEMYNGIPNEIYVALKGEASMWDPEIPARCAKAETALIELGLICKEATFDIVGGLLID